MPSSEREDLQELLSIPGFQRFAQRTLNEYVGQGYRYRMRQALKDGDLVALKVVEEVSAEVERLLSWPEARLQELNDNPREGD